VVGVPDGVELGCAAGVVGVGSIGALECSPVALAVGVGSSACVGVAVGTWCTIALQASEVNVKTDTARNSDRLGRNNAIILIFVSLFQAQIH
jgi:hypothetical protein